MSLEKAAALRERAQMLREAEARWFERGPKDADARYFVERTEQQARELEKRAAKFERSPAKMTAEVKRAVAPTTIPAATTAKNVPLPPNTVSTSEYARLMAQTRALAPGIVAGTREVANMAYQNSDKFLKDAKRVIAQTAAGNFAGNATRAAAKNAGGAQLGGAMAQAANMRALTRLIPVIGQVAGTGMLAAEVGSGLYDVADEEIQDALAALTGTDPATGMRSETSPGMMLDKITQSSEEFMEQAREAAAVTQGWERGIMPAGQKPRK